MSTQDALPPRLRTAYIAVTEFPSTNGIKVVALAMFIATGVFLAFASMQSADISEVTLTIWLSAVLACLGIGNWAESIKRKLPYPTPPAPPDAENVAATTGTPAPPEPTVASPPKPTKMPEPVVALNAAVAARTADPTKPIGELVDGTGD